MFDKDSSTPLWNYHVSSSLHDIAISSNGEYVAAAYEGSIDKLFLFSIDSNTPLWSYEDGDGFKSVAISADGRYIAAGLKTGNSEVLLFSKDGYKKNRCY